MKYTILLTILLIFYASCTNKNEYIINGTAIDDYEGKTIYLLANKSDSSIIDSTIVANNKFTFRGIAPDSIRIAFLSYDRRYFPPFFILEKGKITLDIDTVYYESFKRGGTVLNEELQLYKNQYYDLLHNSLKYAFEEDSAYQKNPTKEEKMNLEKKRETLYREIEDYVYDYIVKHSQNALGEQIFIDDAYFIRPNKANKLTEFFKADFNNKNPRFKAVIDAQEATSPGKRYTDIKGFDINGDETSLSNFIGKGNIVLINFWASWCGPCINELPELKKFYKDNIDKGLVIIGVSLDTNEKDWMTAIKKHDIEWTQISNLKGIDDPAAIAYGVKWIPQLILIDRNGTIISRNAERSRLQSMFDDLYENNQILKSRSIENRNK